MRAVHYGIGASIILLSAAAQSQGVVPAASDTSQLLTPTRQAYVNWQKAGLQSVGGIPSRTKQCGSTLKPSGSDDTDAINAAIDRCPAGDVLVFGPGTFLINAAGYAVSLNKGITLRGQGPGTTILHSANGATLNSYANGMHAAAIIRAGGSAGLGSSTTLTADGAQGAYSVTVSSVSGFAVGDLLHIDELAIGKAMPDCCFNGGSKYASFAGAIRGTTLLSSSSAPLQIGAMIFGPGVTTGTVITAGGTGSWTVNNSQTVNLEALTATATVWAMPDYRVMWNQHYPKVAYYDSACVGYDNNNNWSAPCAANGDECAYSVRCGGVVEELHLITAVSKATKTITFDSPLTISYRTADNASVRDYPRANLTFFAGVENMTLSNGDEGNLVFQGCVYCWAHAVESTLWLNAGGFAFYNAAFRDQVDFSYVHNAAWPVNGGGGYAINLTYGASEEYIFNNIDVFANKVDVVRASGAGTVFAYNYMDNGYIHGEEYWAETGMNCSHLAGSHHVLFEGNQSWNSDNDATHGSVGHCTWFRNWMTGFRAPFTALGDKAINDSANTPSHVGPLRAMGDHMYSYWDSFVGNVVGTSGAVSSWTLRCEAGNADGGCAPALYNLGWNDTSVGGSLGDASMNIDYPTSPANTITGPGCLASGESCAPIRDGNYDYKTNAIQWASNDTAHILPSSFYLSAVPMFFGAGSGYPWPWVVPENNATQLPKGCGGKCSGLPAKARWDAGTPFTQP